jgi:integrase
MADRQVDPTQFMSLAELRAIVTEAERRARRSVHSRQKLIIFRLATFCGLRAAEIAGLELRDVRCDSDVPHINLRRGVAKRGKARKVPLRWDEPTLAALAAWRAFRLAAGAEPTSPLVCTLHRTVGRLQPGQAATGGAATEPGRPLNHCQVATKFKAVLRAAGQAYPQLLPPERIAELHTHSGRHTWISLMIPVHGLAAVRDAGGHASIATTKVYLHANPDEIRRSGSVLDSVPLQTGPASSAPPAP